MFPFHSKSLFSAFVVSALSVFALMTALSASPESSSEQQQLVKLLSFQQDAWNRGDIESFMTVYWKSPELTFSSGGEVERGWEATRARYLKRYPTKDAMGKLTFSGLEVRFVGDQAALMLGNWKLDRENPIGGNFSLVWQKFDDGWKIIHDHTSKKD